jgi:hypothetical protein
MRKHYEFEPHEIIVIPRQVENLEKLRDELNLDDETRLVCRNIQSMKRTQRVQGLLDFYKRCNIKFQITPGDNSEYQERDACCLLVLDSVTSAPQCIRQPRPRVYLKEGTYHTRLFRGPSTNGMKKWDGPSRSWPTNIRLRGVIFGPFTVTHL